MTEHAPQRPTQGFVSTVDDLPLRFCPVHCQPVQETMQGDLAQDTVSLPSFWRIQIKGGRRDELTNSGLVQDYSFGSRKLNCWHPRQVLRQPGCNTSSKIELGRRRYSIVPRHTMSSCLWSPRYVRDRIPSTYSIRITSLHVSELDGTSLSLHTSRID